MKISKKENVMKFGRTGVLGGAVVLAAVLMVGPTVFAQPSGGGNPDIVGDWDADGDGNVTRAEWQRSDALFDTYDKNGNDVIDMDERPAMPTDELMDADGDGKVSEAEFIGPSEFFKQLDKNGDGYLTPDEKQE
jgi:hypothetical protein